MKVSHAADHATSAVIGSKDVIEMGITNDPTFMQILASTLYKFPILAFVRETLSNAWDAHIDASIDRPIVVEITDTHFIVQDFGKGIPHNIFGKVYGTFGASTKKEDRNSIGGLTC